MEEQFSIEHDKYDDVYAQVDIISDAESSYMVWGDFDHAEIFSAEDRTQFWDKVREEGLDEDDVQALVSPGHVVKNNTIYFGLERYRHSGDVYALCRRGNFPDRQWDVSPIVGWVKPHPDVDNDLISILREARIGNGVFDLTEFTKRMARDVEHYNDAIGGNCWGYRVVLFDGDEEVGVEDSCWGFLGDADYCKDEAERSAKYMLEQYKPQHRICDCCGQRIKN